MTELAIWHIEYDTVVDLVPLCVGWQKDKLRIRVHKLFDKPRTGNAVYFNFLASDPFHKLDSCFVAAWFWYAVVAAILYGAHQIFTKLAADRIGEGLGGFVVEATAALSILVYLAFLWLANRIAFFLLFQKGGPLSSVPAILAGGAAIMAIAGILFFHESLSWQRLIGVVLAIAGLFLLRK